MNGCLNTEGINVFYLLFIFFCMVIYEPVRVCLLGYERRAIKCSKIDKVFLSFNKSYSEIYHNAKGIFAAK